MSKTAGKTGDLTLKVPAEWSDETDSDVSWQPPCEKSYTSPTGGGHHRLTSQAM